jgi:hypothetical protein
MTYDQEEMLLFLKNLLSWILNEDTCRWDAPVVKPDDGQDYIWNETIQNWELVE